MKTYQSIKADPRGGIFGKTIWLMALVAMFLVSPLASATVWDLTAGQTNVVGTVTVTNDPSNVYVTYKLTNPTAKFGTLHLWVGSNLTDLPVNQNSIPVPGNFPNKINTNNATEYTFIIPFTIECNASVYVVAHAEVNYFDSEGKPILVLNKEGELVQDGDTAFGGDITGTGNRWWFYGQHTLTCPPPPGDEDEAHSQWCSPGYWRNHLAAWELTGYSTSDNYFLVTGESVVLSKSAVKAGATLDPTLLQVLQAPQYYGGTAFNTVGDVLSTGHTGVNFTGERYFDVNGDGDRKSVV